MQTSGFQGYGRGIRKVGPKFSDSKGVGDRASDLGTEVKSCGRGVRLLQPSENWTSPGGCSSNNSSYISTPSAPHQKLKYLSPIRGRNTTQVLPTSTPTKGLTLSPKTPRVLPSSPGSTGSVSPPQEPCECNFCNRPAGQLVCQTCSHSFQGRVRMRCPQHPGIIHLMDCEFCPQCLSNQLLEFKMA